MGTDCLVRKYLIYLPDRTMQIQGRVFFSWGVWFPNSLMYGINSNRRKPIAYSYKMKTTTILLFAAIVTAQDSTDVPSSSSVDQVPTSTSSSAMSNPTNFIMKCPEDISPTIANRSIYTLSCQNSNFKLPSGSIYSFCCPSDTVCNTSSVPSDTTKGCLPKSNAGSWNGVSFLATMSTIAAYFYFL